MADNTWAVLRWSARSLTQGTPNGRFSRLPGFGIYTRRMSGARISLAVNGSEHRLYPFPEGLLCLSHGLAVHPWSRALRNLTQIRPYSFSCDVMGQGSEPQFWLTSCLRCYSFESCFHGWFIFSLHRSPDLSLDRAHVSPRTIHLLLTASPCSRLSRPRSTISQSDFHQAVGPSSPCQLVRSYRLSPEPDGSPLFP